MFPYISHDILTALWEHAEQEAPKEAVGLLEGNIEPLDQTCVVYDALSPLENMAQDPSNNFVLYRRQIQEMKDMRLHGVLLCLWHSHVDKLPALSGEDLEVMWQIKLPMLVVGLAYKTAVMFTYLAPRPSDGKQAVVQWGKWGKPDG